MNTENNVVSFNDGTGFTGLDTTTATTASTSTITINANTFCANCSVWHSGWHVCPTISWYPTYPVYKTDEVAELKAWIEGFMDGRKMTERNLKKIQDKLEDFTA